MIPLPPEFVAALEALFAGRAEVRAGDLPPPAEALTVWALAHALRRTVVWICDGPASLDTRHADLRALSGAAPGDVPYFPAWDTLPGPRAFTSADVVGHRFLALERLASATPPRVIATCIQALMESTLRPDVYRAGLLRLACGLALAPDALAARLVAAGYAIVPEVQDKGQAALKGGIVDAWSVAEPWPVRLDFFGDQLESIRTFNPLDQRSIERLPGAALPPVSEWAVLRDRPEAAASLLDHLPVDAVFAWSDRESVEAHAGILEAAAASCPPSFVTPCEDLLAAIRARAPRQLFTGNVTPDEDARVLDFVPAASAFGLPRHVLQPDVMEHRRHKLMADLRREAAAGKSIHLFFEKDAARDRFAQEMAGDLDAGFACHVAPLSEGFASAHFGLVAISESDLYGRRHESVERYTPAPRGVRAAAVGARLGDLASLEPGDLVVHVDHGIGRYLGLQTVRLDGREQEALAIEYAGNAKLYIPATHIHVLSRYAGAGKRHVKLHQLGGRRWHRERDAAERAVQDLAASLLETQAARDALPGFAFSEDKPWQRQLENAFRYRETPDQERAIASVKRDMQSTRPMDRLICGDAGYGKTEVAIRAAFKAVLDARQVAVLVPTTVLAQQHLDTFRLRLAAFPVRLEMLSRFCPPPQRRAVLEGLASGAIDIVIGTHGLLQPGVTFKELGLVVIDEEQRFGVRHKEKLKRLRTLVDVLTLTATPIPRTLYMSVTGAKDLSTIETPPQQRRAVETIVGEYSDATLREAVLRELNREGQVYYVHNRVMTIERVHQRLRETVPEARVAVAHGQMAAGELSAVMESFAEGRVDVLLCTTIIESGLDVPNANTILIDRADRFGLADLYQLRGRVGRSHQKAYAYFLLPARAALDPTARRRIGAIQQYNNPGAGFRLAMRDLEIRGAGNLLGPEQSGHIAAVGFQLYCQLLQRSIRQLKGETIPPVSLVDLRLDFLSTRAAGDGDATDYAGIPYDYIEDEKVRIETYRRLTDVATLDELRQLRDDFTDRFGGIPRPMEALFTLGEIRVVAAQKNLRCLETRKGRLMLSGADDFVKPGGRFPELRSAGVQSRLHEILGILRALR